MLAEVVCGLEQGTRSSPTETEYGKSRPHCSAQLARMAYGVSADEAHRFGLPCGGTLELVLEPNPYAASLLALVKLLADGHMVQRRTGIAVSIMAEALAAKIGVPLPRDMGVTHAKKALCDSW